MAARKKSKTKKYTYAVGRRRRSSARVRLYKGKEQSMVNGVAIGKYFPGEVYRTLWSAPFEITGTVGKFYITAKVVGGGKKGQLDAVMHGTARAFCELDSEKYRASLKREGLLTRDDRRRQRRMVGTGGKARRKKQSPKR